MFFQGKLTGQGLEDQLPTVVITTHYDSYGVVPVSLYYIKFLSLQQIRRMLKNTLYHSTMINRVAQHTYVNLSNLKLAPKSYRGTKDYLMSVLYIINRKITMLCMPLYERALQRFLCMCITDGSKSEL